jgi:hypothetical protein
VLSLGAIAWGIAGCGGGSGQATTAGSTSTDSAQASTPAISKPATPEQAPGGASFIASTGAVCRRRGPEVEAASIYSASVPAIIAAARKRAAIEHNGLNELEALTPPSSIASGWRSYIADAKNALAAVTKLGDLGAHPERALLESSYYAYLKALEQLRAAAGQAGLVGCAQYG